MSDKLEQIRLARFSSIGIISVLYIGVPLLILFNIIPWDYKFWALSAGALFVFIVLKVQGVSNADLGFSLHQWRTAVLSVVPMTAALSIISIVYLILNGSRYSPTETIYFYLFYIFVSCPAQELLFRSALRVLLRPLGLTLRIEMLVAASLFGFVHVIYKDPFTLAAMIIVGFFWYHLYLRTRNLIGVTISHITLGILTIALGLVN